MNINNKLILAWSGGKDSALALYELKRENATGIVALLTTVTEGYDRISMHGVRRSLLLEQAEVLGYPLEEITIPQDCSNDIYENRMRTVLEKHKQRGVTAVAFGDLFLEDIRSYREKNLNRIGMQSIFPLWNKDTVTSALYQVITIQTITTKQEVTTLTQARDLGFNRRSTISIFTCLSLCRT